MTFPEKVFVFAEGFQERAPNETHAGVSLEIKVCTVFTRIFSMKSMNICFALHFKRISNQTQCVIQSNTVSLLYCWTFDETRANILSLAQGDTLAAQTCVLVTSVTKSI